MATQQPYEESLIDKGTGALKPWRKGAAWWLVLVEGIVLLAVGIYMLVAPENTRVMMGWVLAALLAFMGLVELFSGLTMRRAGGPRPATLIMGAVGLVLGVVGLIMLANDSVSLESTGVVLGIGAVAFGLVGIVRYFVRRNTPLGTGRTVMPVFLLIIGILELMAAAGVGDMATYVKIVGILLVVAGVAMVGWAFLRRRARNKVAGPGAPGAAR